MYLFLRFTSDRIVNPFLKYRLNRLLCLGFFAVFGSTRNGAPPQVMVCLGFDWFFLISLRRHWLSTKSYY